MGKGNRSRTERASAIVANAAPVKKNSNKKTNVITAVVVAVVALLIVGSILISASVNNGWFERSKIAVKSDNYKITGTMLSYYVYTYYMNNLQSNASYYGIDTSTPLEDQEYSDGQTYFDVIATMLSETLKQKLAFCEGAKKAGMELDDADKKEIDDAIASMESYATQQLMTLKQLCVSYFGSGVNESDVRKAMEIDALYSKYLTKLMEDTEGAVTEDEVKKYLEENPESFYTADVLQYTLTAKLTTADATATQAEKDAYAADKATMLEKVNAIKSSATTVKEFKAAVANNVIATSFEETFSTAYAAKAATLADADKPTESAIADAKALIKEYVVKVAGEETATAPVWSGAAYANALIAARDAVYAEVITNTVEKLASEQTYSDPTSSSATDLAKFVFADGRKDGDTEVITSEGDSQSTYTVVMVSSSSHKDESITRNVAHILVQGEDSDNLASDDAKAKAQEALAKYNGGEKTQAAFEKLAEEYNQDSACVYEGVYEGQMVTNFNKWLFDENRKTGDVDIVETEYGFHVVYYIGLGHERWYEDSKDAVVEKKLTDWCNEKYTEFHITLNEKVFG